MDNTMHLSFESRIYLEFPDESGICQAYLELPKNGRLELLVNLADLDTSLQALQKVGFIGIRITNQGIWGPLIRMSAFKGKEGPCYDTGRTAQYNGAALAVMDDDHHIIFETVQVCEKTANLYQSKIYTDFITVSPPDTVKLERLSTNPIPFNCDTLEQDLKRLKDLLSDQSPEIAQVTILYPGPFRLLILKDGRIVRRGKLTLVSEKQAAILTKSDNCMILPEQYKSTQRAEIFQNLDNKSGGLEILETNDSVQSITSRSTVHLATLNGIPVAFKERLKKLIISNENYLILTGSDPWDVYGCCPSVDVGSANRLVEAGILQSWQTNSAPDACPCSIYAFNEEITRQNGKPHFTINDSLRTQVLHYINKKNATTLLGKKIVTWSLLAFVLGALVYGLLYTPRNFKNEITPMEKGESIADYKIPDGLHFFLFHYQKQCTPCKHAEDYLKDIVEHRFNSEKNTEKIRLEKILIDKEPVHPLVDHFGIVYSSLAITRIKNNKIIKNKIYDYELWKLVKSKPAFERFISGEIQDFLKNQE